MVFMIFDTMQYLEGVECIGSYIMIVINIIYISKDWGNGFYDI